MGWLAPTLIPHKNASRGSLTLDDVDEDTHSILDECTRYDQYLYDYVVQKPSRHKKKPLIVPVLDTNKGYSLTLDQAFV